MGECKTLIVWINLDEAIRGVVDHITLADLMENGKAVSGTVIVFLLGSAVIFSVGKLRSKKVKK